MSTRNDELGNRGQPVTGARRSGARPARGFWAWIVAACALQLAGWVAWFVVTAGHSVEEVPLATAGAR